MISLNYISFFILFMCFILFISGLMRLFLFTCLLAITGFVHFSRGFGTGNSIKFLVHCYNYSLLYNLIKKAIKDEFIWRKNRFGVPYLNLRTSKKSIRNLKKRMNLYQVGLNIWEIFLNIRKESKNYVYFVQA